jgi:hypothetical protein
MIPFGLQKNLGLMHQPPKRLGVDDSINVPLKAGAKGAVHQWALPPP